jgi:hypothetical protein
MAKHHAKKHDDEADDAPTPASPDAATGSNTTSGGRTPEPAGDDPATADGGAARGTAVYPPSPGDQAGERTSNVAPSKQLPPDVPPGESGADELATLRAQNAALAGVVRNLGGNPEAVAREAAAGLQQEAKAARGPVKKARVTMPGQEAVEVEYPAAAADPRAAARASFTADKGQWALPAEPHVELTD